MSPNLLLRIYFRNPESRYRGQLTGKSVFIDGMHFKLEEVAPDSRDSRHRRRMIDSRAHFELEDRIVRSGRNVALLCLNVLVSNGENRGWKLYIGGPLYEYQKDWDYKARIPVGTITKGASELLTTLQKKGKLDSWLTTMTPPGWFLPANLSTFK